MDTEEEYNRSADIVHQADPDHVADVLAHALPRISLPAIWALLIISRGRRGNARDGGPPRQRRCGGLTSPPFPITPIGHSSLFLLLLGFKSNTPNASLSTQPNHSNSRATRKLAHCLVPTMIFEPQSLLDHAVTLGIITPQVVRQAGPIRGTIALLKLLFVFCTSVPPLLLQSHWRTCISI